MLASKRAGTRATPEPARDGSPLVIAVPPIAVRTSYDREERSRTQGRRAWLRWSLVSPGETAARSVSRDHWYRCAPGRVGGRNGPFGLPGPVRPGVSSGSVPPAQPALTEP